MFNWLDDVGQIIWSAILAICVGLALYVIYLNAVVLLQWGRANAETGIASVYSYGKGTRKGSLTACGHVFNPSKLIVAHRTLPCGTTVRISTGRSSIIATVDDRGPWAKGRIVDLTPADQHELGVGGLSRVKLEVVHENISVSSPRSSLGISGFGGDIGPQGRWAMGRNPIRPASQNGSW